MWGAGPRGEGGTRGVCDGQARGRAECVLFPKLSALVLLLFPWGVEVWAGDTLVPRMGLACIGGEIVSAASFGGSFRGSHVRTGAENASASALTGLSVKGARVCGEGGTRVVSHGDCAAALTVLLLPHTAFEVGSPPRGMQGRARCAVSPLCFVPRRI